MALNTACGPSLETTPQPSLNSGQQTDGGSNTTTTQVSPTTTLPNSTTTTLPSTTTTIPSTTTTIPSTTTTTVPVGQVTRVTMTVQNTTSTDGPADLVSNGIPFKPGVLTNINNFRILDGSNEVATSRKILARWPNNSVRVVLVQFSAPFAGSSKNFTLELGANAGTAVGATSVVNFRLPRKIALLPAQYLSDSLVFWEQKPFGTSGYASWETKQQNDFQFINTEPVASNTCARTDQYYDSISTSYQLYTRSGQLQHLTNGRRWAIHHRANQIYLGGSNIGRGICSGNYVLNTRYTFVDGLVRDYFFFGDEESLRVAGLVVDNFYMNHEARWYYKAPNTTGFWTEREAAFAQLGLLAYYEATGNTAYLNRARDRFYELHRMQLENGRRAWIHNLYDHDPTEGCPTDAYGSSPFMTGLLSESLIRFHKLTKDTRAAESITWAAADLRDSAIATTGAGAGSGFVYLGCRTVYTTANPDIDNLIAHLYAYAYRISGFQNQSFRDTATRVFNYSVSNGFSRAPKQFNQMFRSSGSVPAYLDPTLISY